MAVAFNACLRSRPRRRRWFLVLAALVSSHTAMAQQPAPAERPQSVGERADATGYVEGLDIDSVRPLPDQSAVASTSQEGAEEGACGGCPARRLGTSFLQVTYVNIVYELANLIRGQDTAKITPGTWWTNMKRGWEWDLDDFAVNQIGHPYQGNNYFNAARANGLSFWESSALTAFGSGTWEYFGETNQASLNDFINTTLGGISLGEMFHRAAWLVRDTRVTGRSRLWKEIGATAIDPITGANRFASGDASRVSEKPPEMVPSGLGVVGAAGVLWRDADASDADSTIDSTTDPFVELNLIYGDLETGRSRKPYDAFAVRLDFGGGGPVSEARVRGRLLGQPYRNGGLQLSVAQGYQYYENDAYQFGAQSFEATLGATRTLTSRISLWAIGWGGLTVLGAVDSKPLPGTEQVPAEPDPGEEAGQGVSVGPRFYDYGPGTTFGGLATLRRDGRTFFTISYEAHHLHVLDGVRANHLLQHARADLRVPLPGSLGIGVTAEYFDRRTYYQEPGVSPGEFHFPQIRTALIWSTP
jgi:hypothetical protein